jgi:hypothetical protein
MQKSIKLTNKGSKHQLISRIKRNPLHLIILCSGGFLIALLILLFLYYPNLSLNTNINGTLFAVLLGAIFSTVGIIFKWVYDYLDGEKKKNEKLLEGTLDDVEKYYYPLALAAQGAALHLKETIVRALEIKSASDESVEQKPLEAELTKVIASELNKIFAMNKYRIAYSLFLIGRFYYHKFSQELTRAG